MSNTWSGGIVKQEKAINRERAVTAEMRALHAENPERMLPEKREAFFILSQRKEDVDG
jgi:hypothetical protein